MKNVLKFILIAGVISIFIVGIIVINRKKSENTPATIDVNSGESETLGVRENDNIRGDKNAPITIIDYADYQCSYCISYDKALNQIIAAYPSKVRLVYRHFPLPFHKAAKNASIAAEAAGAQGRYWEFHDKLVANSQPDGRGLEAEDLIRYATELKLNLDQFKKDLTNSAYIDKVEADAASGTALKIKGTPSSFLIDRNGNIEQLEGSLSFSQLKSKIEAVLAR